MVFSVGLQGCHAQQTWPLWQAYTQHFLDQQGRVIDRSAGDRTTSEGQAYAMFFALVDNDRPRFDKLLNWTEINMAGGDLTLRLPAWLWGKNNSGVWTTIDSNPASDADVWMSYTLLQAGRLWHEPRYEQLGRMMALRIAKQEVVSVPGLGPTLAPGPTGFNLQPGAWVLNPSYLPPSLLVYFARTMLDGPWSAVLATLPALLGGSASHGFAMDWVKADRAGVLPSSPPVAPTSGTRESQAAGSYDAIRVYLWLGLADSETPGRQELLSRVAGMGGYLQGALVPPEVVDQAGAVIHPEGPPGFSAAVAPYLVAIGMKAQAKMQQDRLAATRDSASGLYGRQGAYYDQNLALFSTAFREGRYRFGRDGMLAVQWK